MGKWLAGLLETLVIIALFAAGVWYGLPALYAKIEDGERAKLTAHLQAGALDADTKAATRAQASCSAEVSHAMDAAKAIAIAAKPAVITAGQPRPMITADQIKAMIQ